MSEEDILLIKRRERYFDRLKERYLFYLNEFFPRVAGQRIPLLHDLAASERDEYLLLVESARIAQAADAGSIEATAQSLAFRDNVDGAQERLAELELQFGGQ
ncbi:MAG: hypothetical protein IIB65_06335 [Proteobacteria bacterium]|nr:hypothetical protein [Pseudomonadota bacterium]